MEGHINISNHVYIIVCNFLVLLLLNVKGHYTHQFSVSHWYIQSRISTLSNGVTYQIDIKMDEDAYLEWLSLVSVYIFKKN